MKEEIRRIMQMVEEGKLSSDEATELMNALNEPPEQTKETEETNRSYMGRSLKIRIKEKDKDKERIRLNIHNKFVKWVIKTDHGIAQAIPDAKPYIEDIDLNVVMQAIDNHETGKIIDLTTEEGEEITLYIE